MARLQGESEEDWNAGEAVMPTKDRAARMKRVARARVAIVSVGVKKLRFTIDYL